MCFISFNLATYDKEPLANVLVTGIDFFPQIASKKYLYKNCPRRKMRLLINTLYQTTHDYP